MNNSSSNNKKYDFDLIVIGSGAAGTVAAHTAASIGKKVAIVEMHKFGGDNIHSGAIPTKTLVEAANNLALVQSAHRFGIRASAVSFNYRSIKALVEQSVNFTGAKNELKAFKADGIIAIHGHGHAHFIDLHTISVGLKHLTAEKFLVASGASPYIPKIEGLDETGYITYKQAIDLNKPPKSLFIIGGGSVAYEFGQIFARFGSKIHIAEIKDHLLPKEDPEIGDSAEAALTEMGARVHCGAKIISVSGSYGRKIVTFEQGGQHHKVNVEEIMIACGKLPFVDFGLANASINNSVSGIKVSSLMQTSQKNIFAAGEVTGVVYSTHGAIHQARIAIHNLYSRKKIKMEYSAIPRVVFGMPEIAATGMSEHQLIKSDIPYQSAIAPIALLGKSITTSYSYGFVKLLASHTGVLLGASVVAPLASEMIGELNLAVQQRMHACDVAKTVHALPTWSEAIAIAANKIYCI